MYWSEDGWNGNDPSLWFNVVRSHGLMCVMLSNLLLPCLEPRSDVITGYITLPAAALRLFSELWVSGGCASLLHQPTLLEHGGQWGEEGGEGGHQGEEQHGHHHREGVVQQWHVRNKEQQQ